MLRLANGTMQLYVQKASLQVQMGHAVPMPRVSFIYVVQMRDMGPCRLGYMLARYTGPCNAEAYKFVDMSDMAKARWSNNCLVTGLFLLQVLERN